MNFKVIEGGSGRLLSIRGFSPYPLLVIGKDKTKASANRRDHLLQIIKTEKAVSLIGCVLIVEIKGPKSWWIAKSITIYNDRRELWIDFGLIYQELRSYRFCNSPTFRSFDTHSCMAY